MPFKVEKRAANNLPSGDSEALFYIKNPIKQLGRGPAAVSNNYAVSEVLYQDEFGTVSPLSNIVAIEGGHEHFCAIDNIGQMYCWGQNNAGQIGAGDITTSGNSTLCMGSNDYAKLGIPGSNFGDLSTHPIPNIVNSLAGVTAAVKLGFDTSSATSLTVNSCQAYDVSILGDNNLEFTALGSEVLGLSSAGGTFYSDAGCFTPLPAKELPLQSGNTLHKFYYLANGVAEQSSIDLNDTANILRSTSLPVLKVP